MDVFSNAFPSSGGSPLPPVDTNDQGIIRTMRKQFAWYFAQDGKDAFGRTQYAEGVLINCRWDNFVSKELVEGRLYEDDVRSTVYLDRRVEVGDILMREESSTGPAPTPDEDNIVRDYKEYPNIRNTSQLRIAIL